MSYREPKSETTSQTISMDQFNTVMVGLAAILTKRFMGIMADGRLVESDSKHGPWTLVEEKVK